MAIRYFQFVAWEQWYPRKDYKSIPWIKLSTSFFEDPKLDGLSFIEKGCLIWLLTECGRQNIGDGKVRLRVSFMKSSLSLQRSFSVPSWISSIIQRGVIIEITHEDTYAKSLLELRIRDKNKNPPNPLSEKPPETRIIPRWVGNKFPSGDRREK